MAATYTLSSLVTAFVSRLGESTDDADLVSLVTEWTKSAVAATWSAKRWRDALKYETITYPGSASSYAFHAGWAEVSYIEYNGALLVFTEREKLLRFGYSPDATGTPTLWYLNSPETIHGEGPGKSLALYKIPTSPVSLRVTYFSCQKPTADADVIQLPEWMVDVVYAYVQAKDSQHIGHGTAAESGDHTEDPSMQTWRSMLSDFEARYAVKDPPQRNTRLLRYGVVESTEPVSDRANTGGQ